jgi:hypothetical protein
VSATLDFLVKLHGGEYVLEETMNQGSPADWPIGRQESLFRPFGDAEGLIGVRLSERIPMIPTKSVSSIRFPLEIDFESRMLCPRDVCSHHRATFDTGLTARRYGKERIDG